MNWIYKGKEVKSVEDLPPDTVGFVYEITNNKTQERYIGKKILKHKKTLPPLKGKKRRRVTFKESDWKKYRGSSDTTKQWLIEDCTRVILEVCKNKTMMAYYETKYQFIKNVLEVDNYINENIGGKFYKESIKKWK